MTDPIQTSVLDRMLEQESRQLLEARMLPNEGPLTQKQRDEVVDALNAYIDKHRITQKEIVKQCSGVGAALNPILLKKYPHGPLDDHLRELNNWMEVDARRRATRPQRQFVETGVARKLLIAAQKASEGPLIVVAHGPSGIGKTMVAHVIAERFPGAIYLCVSSGNTSQTALRRMVATRLRFYSGRKRKSDTPGLTLDERIFERLEGSGRLIIVDEAHRLADSGLDFLRDLYDQCKVPVLLLCTKDLLERLRKDSDEDHGQLFSRLGWTCELTRGHDKHPHGSKPLFTVSEIRKLFENEKVKLHPDAQAYLQDVANMLGHGSLRSCERIIRWAVAIERSVKGLGPQELVVLTAACLRKAETESKDDKWMMDDMERRRVPDAASA